MTFVKNKVVSLYGNTATQLTLNSAQVANIIAAIKSVATMHLSMLFRTMFAELDDSLLEISGKFINDHKKVGGYDGTHELRLKNKQIEVLFIRRFEVLYSQSLLLSPKLPPARVQYSSHLNSLQNILEVDQADLESSIMMTHFIAKANKVYKEKTEYMQIGFNFLKTGLYAEGCRMPVAPALIGDAFKVSMELFSEDVVQKTIIYDYFDQCVMQKLGDMYDQINALLRKVGAI